MIIFNVAGDFHGVFGTLPNESYLDESKWIIAEFAEGESFDERYNYSCVEQGNKWIAVKGELIPIDTVEEARMEAEFTANAYSRARQAEYPDWGTQLNKIYDDGIDKWKSEMVDPIKLKYPKPE